MSYPVINRVARFFGYVPARDADADRFDTRAGMFAVNQALYDGNIYAARTYGGFLEDVLTRYVGPAYCDINRFTIYPTWLPFKQIVDVYQNCLPGVWGDELRAADTVDGKPVNSKLISPLARVWKDSGLNTHKSTLIRWAANFGTVGIRVTAEPEQRNKPARSVISVDHPSRLFNFEEDSRGNVTAVVLKYSKLFNFGTLADPDWQSVEVVEEFTKEEFSRRYDDKEQLQDDERRNILGFCPYVILRHKSNETAWGDWAYKGSEAPVHRINWRVSRQDRSIDRHQFPKWFGAGAGDKPETVDMGDTKMSWVKLHPDSPPPLLQAVVADLDQEAAQEFWQALRDELRGRQPELNLNDVKLLANTSGEALAQILKPTEQAVLEVRPSYDHATIRAMQMAVSAGVVVRAWDVGTGTGTAEAADKAYREGLENFDLATRSALPETPQQQLVKAQASVAERKEKAALAKAAVGVSDLERLRLQGYSEDEIEEMGEEIAEQDVIADDEGDGDAVE